MTRRLCVLDIDSTLVDSDVLEFLAERAGSRDTVAAISEKALRGEVGFSESLTQRVATLQGLPDRALDDALARVRFLPGAQNLVETLHGRGWAIGLVSEGFVEIVGPLAARLGITRYRANGLESIDGILTGALRGPIVDAAAKAQALRDFAEAEGSTLPDTVAIGTRASDLDMLNAAGLAIAFNAPPGVQDAADVGIASTRLDAVLEALEDEIP